MSGTEAATYSPGSPSNARREASDPIQHTTIRQILTAVHVQTRFKINDKETGFVQVVANVYDTNFTREKVDFRLDDGTGRIRATKWDVMNEDEEREFAEMISKRFQYARVIGTIGEFRGLHHLKIIKIVLVEDPHEIYHHLLRVMVESLMMERGPPIRSAAQSVKQSTQTTEPLSLRSLQNNLPPVVHHGASDSQSSSWGISGDQWSRTPPRERPVTPVQRPAVMFTPPSHGATESSDDSPISVRIIRGEPSNKSYRSGGYPSSPSPSREPGSSPPAPRREPVSPSPVPKRRRPSSRPSLAPGRLLRSSADQTTTSIAEVSHYQASPLFSSPASSLLSEISQHHGERDQERRIIPQITNDLASDSPVPTRRSTRMSTRLRRDPYSHLSNLQRDIILTIQNTLLEMGEEIGGSERGVYINVIVDSIARRSPGFDRDSFGEAFVSLVNKGYIYSTIDDEHFACMI